MATNGNVILFCDLLLPPPLFFNSYKYKMNKSLKEKNKSLFLILKKILPEKVNLNFQHFSFLFIESVSRMKQEQLVIYYAILTSRHNFDFFAGNNSFQFFIRTKLSMTEISLYVLGTEWKFSCSKRSIFNTIS